MVVPSSPSILAITANVTAPASMLCFSTSVQFFGRIELTQTRLHWPMPALLRARSKALSSDTGLTALPLVMKNSFGINPVFQSFTFRLVHAHETRLIILWYKSSKIEVTS